MHRDVGGSSIGHDEQTAVSPFRQQRGRAAQPGAVLVERTTTRALVADVETLLAPDDPVVPSGSRQEIAATQTKTADSTGEGGSLSTSGQIAARRPWRKSRDPASGRSEGQGLRPSAPAARTSPQQQSRPSLLVSPAEQERPPTATLTS
jgi:hypothetical protein